MVAKRASTPRSSPLRGMPVEEWIRTRVAASFQPLVRGLLALAPSCAPGSSVSIKWGQPVIERDGPIAFIKAAKAHVTLGFWRGAQLDDPRDLLEGGTVMRHLKLSDASQIRTSGAARFLRQAAVLNRKLGDPTRRKAAAR